MRGRFGLAAALLGVLVVGLLVGYGTGLRQGRRTHRHGDPAGRVVADLPADAEPIDLTGASLLSWELLATYAYRPGLEGMPEAVRALDGRRVVMDGFLMTLFQNDEIREFHLVRAHWSCCGGGVPPGLTSAVRVLLADGSAALPNTIKRLRVVGTFRLDEIREKESDIVWSIYTLEDARAVILTTGQK